ncbi:MAG TPA: DUF3592 domain-containing protein [Acidiferrobacteraceae bacterium]|nr:DUF3592 domain-containing protein [Acidiferrobacteraceae bacterium]
MNALSIIKYVFSAIGLGMLIGAYFLYQNTQSFLESAAVTNGSVVELVRSRSSDSTTYAPVVQFKTESGALVEFTSSTSSNPPGYSKGESVEVFYLPSNPQKAKINGLFSLWGAALIVGILGGVFFLVGGGIALTTFLKNRKNEYLRKQGTPISAKFLSVEINRNIRVNRRSPFRVLAQWQNPATSEIHVFKSNNLWFDPTDHIPDRDITVFIERNNPDKYLVDLSFLPKLAR